MRNASFDDMFTYHAPNEVTTPLYAAIRQAEADCCSALVRVAEAMGSPAMSQAADLYGDINTTFRCFALIVNDLDVNGEVPVHDARRSVDAIRLARNAANEGIATADTGRLFAISGTKLQEARWLACSAVALGHLETA